jgi:uncharacterized membrane protein
VAVVRDKDGSPASGGARMGIGERLAATGGSLGGRSAGMVVVVALGLVGTDRLIKHSPAGVDAFIVFAVLIVVLTLTRDPRALLARFAVLGIYLMLCGFGYLAGGLPSTPVGVIGVFFLACGVGMILLVAQAQRRSRDRQEHGASPERHSP